MIARNHQARAPGAHPARSLPRAFHPPQVFRGEEHVAELAVLMIASRELTRGWIIHHAASSPAFKPLEITQPGWPGATLPPALVGTSTSEAGHQASERPASSVGVKQ